MSCFQEKYDILAATELSSRPERSVVEEICGFPEFKTKAIVGLRPSFSAHVRPTASRGR
jgi:hypothetical protein